MRYGALVSQQPAPGKSLAGAAESAQHSRWYAMARQQKLPFGLRLTRPLQGAGPKGATPGQP